MPGESTALDSSGVQLPDSGLRYIDLDEVTRRYMLDEFERDLARHELYLSPHLSDAGRADFVDLLRRAIQSGTDVSFAASLRAKDRMQLTEQWELPRGRVATRALPPTTAIALAEDEFHRFYVRGLCRRALQRGLHTLVICRVRAAASQGPNSDAMVGLQIDARSLLEDLRTPQGRRPPRGVPQCRDPGLSVRFPESNVGGTAP